MFWKKNETEGKSKALEVTEINYMDEVINTDKPVLLDFWAPWCAPCKVMGPIIDELAEEFEGRATVGKINTEQQQKLAGMFKIRSIPTLVVIKDKEIVEMHSGVVPKPNLEEILNGYLDNER